MGGGSYYRDVEPQARSTRRDTFSYQGYASDAARASHPERRECHELVNPKSGRGVRECMDSIDHPDTTGIVAAMDVTRSRGDDAKTVDEKLPMFIGQLIMQGFVLHPVISFAAVGDASSGDQAPIQSGQFESDARLDEVLSKIWLEGKGGGTGQESYELMAYYYARHSVLACNQRGRKGFFFFLGDEGFYPFVRRDQVKVWIGDDLAADIPSPQIFKELQEKYHVFFIFPQKGWEEKKADIDAEIKERVERAGGQYSEVDIRASLLWGNRNDLDLHVITPSGFEIFYGSKQSPCGGWLDVDMNVHGESSKPVENIRWKKGTARPGHYRVFVQNYAFHESPRESATPFRVEIEINGEIRHFNGETPTGLSGPGSNVQVFEFTYDPNERPGQVRLEDMYSNYDSEKIRTQWESVIPAENIVVLKNPRAVVDAMIGAIVLVQGNLDLEGYVLHLARTIGQTEERQSDIISALAPLSRAVGAQTVAIDLGNRGAVGTVQDRAGRSRRL